MGGTCREQERHANINKTDILQVAVVDLNKACGEESKTELDAMFGEGNCYFIPCDVSNGDALRGKTNTDRRLRIVIAYNERN